jgi:putative spermidine/putrescine transport system ATP-binding protein
MRRVDFREVGKNFGPVTALRPTTLAIDAGEFLTLLGPSGSGKTTLLNIAAGYVEPSVGRVLIGERDVTSLPPRRRNVGMVFQSYALFPHLSVAENVAYGLRVRGVSRREIQKRVDAALEMVDLAGFGDRSPRQLSGGQQQRVALARALVIEPDVLLLDEPLGALDRQLRKHVQLEIRRLHQRLGRTMIYVTHDQEEALVMSDRIAVMRDGRIEQIGSGRELYETPANTFVARFLGESNLVQGPVTRLNGERAEIEAASFGAVRGWAAPGLREGTEAAALIRPEAVRLEGAFSGRVVERVYLGELVALRLDVSGKTIWHRGPVEPSAETVALGWHDESVRILPIADEEKGVSP